MFVIIILHYEKDQIILNETSKVNMCNIDKVVLFLSGKVHFFFILFIFMMMKNI